MKRRQETRLKSLRWALVPALLVCFASQASAYTTGIIEWLNFPTLRVASNGHHYTGDAHPLGHGWEGRVEIESSGLPRVKSWSLYPKLNVEGLDTLSFALYKAGKSYPWGNRPQNVYRTVGNTFPSSFVSDYVAEACNLHLELLMNQGYPRSTVLGEDRTIAASMWGSLDIDITVGDPIIEAFHKNVDIVCEKSPVAPPPPTGPTRLDSLGEFILASAGLVIYPDVYSGDCPTELSLFMNVKANHKGTFEARIESTDGWKSTKFVHQTNEPMQNSGLWERDFSEPLPVPLQKPQGGSGGGVGVPPGPGNFAVPSPPGDDLFPGQGGASGHAVGGLTGHDPGSNVHQASLRLVAKANGKTVYSDWRQYRVTCDPKVAIQTGSTNLMPGGAGPDDPRGPGPSGGKPEPKPARPGADKPAPQPSPQAPSARPDASKSRRSETKAKKAAKPSAKPDAKPDAKPGANRNAKPNAKPSKVQGKRQPPKASKEPSSAAKAGKARAKTASKPSAKGVRRGSSGEPDLTVVRARRSAKTPRAIEFLVENVGQAASSKTSAKLTCAAAGGGAENWRAVVPALEAGAKRWIESSPSRVQRTRTRVRGCRIVLDPDNALAEGDESNNAFSCPGCAAASKSRR